MATIRKSTPFGALLLAVLALMLAFGLSFAPAAAQDVPEADEAASVAEGTAEGPEGFSEIEGEAAPGAEAGSYTPLGPEWIKGQPTPGGITFQDQYSENGRYGLWMHNWILMPFVVAICLFVLGLILWAVTRYRRHRNPTPSRTTHNTTIEVIWTLVPVLILVVIAIPSIRLLSKQYEPPPEDAITIKATGYQWYWGYSYPDHGDFEVISNMLPEGDAIAAGLPPQLAADNRMVVPAGVPLRILTTGADVIHSFAVPSLWFKMDAVPGRLNESMLTIDEPGIYYGQCMELCGARHAYMPIAVEALPFEQWQQWVLTQGGTLTGDEVEDEDLEAAPLQEPESSIPGAPGDGPAPTGDTAPGTPSNANIRRAPASTGR